MNFTPQLLHARRTNSTGSFYERTDRGSYVPIAKSKLRQICKKAGYTDLEFHQFIAELLTNFFEIEDGRTINRLRSGQGWIDYTTGESNDVQLEGKL